MRRSLFPLVLLGAAATGCNGTTGDQLITFPAYAAGAAGAGEPFTVQGADSAHTFKIQLTLAQMYIGAVYVNEAPAGSGGTFDTPVCISSGVYCAQVPGGLEVNLLSTKPQAWPSTIQGTGSADLGASWELYLTDGDVNNPDNTGFGIPNAVDLAGTATRESDEKVFSWAATVTVNEQNRGISTANEPSEPGLNPICRKRIIQGGAIHLQLFPGGSLLVTVDPRGWFTVPLDFSTLPPVFLPQCHLYGDMSMYGTADFCIPDSSNRPGTELGATQGASLFENGIRTGGAAAYTLSYSSPL